MLRIDLRHQERDVGLHAVITRIRHHHMSGRSEGLLDLGGYAVVHYGEDELRRFTRLALIDCDAADGFGERAEMPGHGIGVLLSGRTVAGSEPHEVKPGMALEKFDKVLAHHAGGAEDAYFDSRLHSSFTMFW